MKLEIPEPIVFSDTFEYYDSYGEKQHLKVVLTEKRLIIDKGKSKDSILVPYINSITFKKEENRGYLYNGIVILIFGILPFIILPLFPTLRKMPYITETPFKEILAFILIIVSIILVISWLLSRKFRLIINSFGYYSYIQSKNENKILKLFNFIEKQRAKLPKEPDKSIGKLIEGD
jgi:hypothetical protein